MTPNTFPRRLTPADFPCVTARNANDEWVLGPVAEEDFVPTDVVVFVDFVDLIVHVDDGVELQGEGVGAFGDSPRKLDEVFAARGDIRRHEDFGAAIGTGD